MEVEVAGIPVQIYGSKLSLIEYMLSRLSAGDATVAIAVNPEKIVGSLQNRDLYNTLKRADIRYPDGIGLAKLMSFRAGVNVPRIAGCELWEELMYKSAEDHVPVYLVGATLDVNNRAKEQLTAAGVNVVGSVDGYFQDREAVVEEIRRLQPGIVSVALGSPKQELFINDCLNAGINCIFMGVGGTFDVFVGNVKRAPLLMRRFGLEWLYRLCVQPSRYRRHFNLIKFVYLASRGRI